MAQWFQTKLRGVATHKNSLSETREGQVRRAESLVNDREGLHEPRRGVPYESTTPIRAPGKESKKLMCYQGKLIAHVEDELWRRVSAGSWIQYTGTFEDPVAGYRVQSVVANKNFFFCTDDGTFKLDDVTGTPRASGTQRPLDASYTLTGASGFMADDTAVGYRFSLYYTDANDNEIESALSQTLVAQNTVGGAATRNVALTVYIPSGLTTSYYWRAYRSAQTEAAADVPSEEIQVCAEGQLTSANLAAGTFTVTDSTPDSLRGAIAYISPSQGNGIADQNDRPPLALDLCLFKGYVFYANVLGRERYFLRLLGASTTGAGLRYVADNVSTTNASAAMTSVGDTTLLRVGMKIKATAGIPSTARILTLDTATTLTMTVNATATGARDVEFEDILRVDGVEYFAASATTVANKEFLATLGGTASQNIEATARAIMRVVNGNATADVYAYYTSPFDGTPGEMLFEERSIGGAAFQMSTTATGAFSPTLPSTDDGSQLSQADESFNSCAISKFQQPEAVPVGQKILCGDTDVIRVLALRDAVIVLSLETVGIITGTDITNFRYDVLDQTTHLFGPETAVVVNDGVEFCSNQGTVRVTTQGVEIGSRDIERDLIMSAALANFDVNAWGLAAETDRSYGLFIPTSGVDTQAEFSWRRNALTESWTHSIVHASCGLVDPASDELVLIDQDTLLVRRERRSYSRSDYADDSLAVNITSSSGTTVNLTSTANLLDRDLLVQGAVEVRIADVVSGTVLLMAETATWSNGAATAYRPIDCSEDTLPEDFGEPGTLKKVTEFQLAFREAQFDRFTVAFATDLQPNFTAANTVTLYPGTRGTSWTDTPAGADPVDEQVIRSYVPRACQYGHWIRMRITWSIARERMAFAGYGYKARTLGADRAKGAAA